MRSALPIRATAHGVELDLLVSPRASKSGVDGLHDHRIRVRVKAPPVDGAANAALIELFSDILDVPRARVRVRTGETGRRKTLAIDGATAADVAGRLRLEEK